MRMIYWKYHTKTGELTTVGLYLCVNHIKITKKKYMLYADKGEGQVLGFLRRSDHYIRYRT